HAQCAGRNRLSEQLARRDFAEETRLPPEVGGVALSRHLQVRREPQPLPVGGELTLMRVLAFRHVPFEGLGLIEPALQLRHIEVDYADLYQSGRSEEHTSELQSLTNLVC